MRYVQRYGATFKRDGEPLTLNFDFTIRSNKGRAIELTHQYTVASYENPCFARHASVYDLRGDEILRLIGSDAEEVFDHFTDAGHEALLNASQIWLGRVATVEDDPHGDPEPDDLYLHDI